MYPLMMFDFYALLWISSWRAFAGMVIERCDHVEAIIRPRRQVASDDAQIIRFPQVSRLVV